MCKTVNECRSRFAKVFKFSSFCLVGLLFTLLGVLIAKLFYVPTTYVLYLIIFLGENDFRGPLLISISK